MKFRHLFIGLLIFANINVVKAQSWEKYINLDQYLKPFWKADTIHDEMILPISGNGTLLFQATKILSVRSSDLQTEFKEGKDWTYEQGRIQLTANSTLPSLKNEDLVFTSEKPGLSMRGKKSGTFVLFSETPYFAAHQIAVTYVRAKKDKWQGLIPRYSGGQLSLSTTALCKGNPFKVVFYGNSIEAGYNSSALLNRPPYLPSWPELIIYGLRKHYTASTINFTNASVPGKLAAWGEENAAGLVASQNPDLVIIGFGMNDGSAMVAPELYRKQIEGIINTVSATKKTAEFILIAPMLPNPDAIQNGIQAQYKAELDKLARLGVVVADMTAIHRQLLLKKRYQDMTGNNVNHPNDYLIRWYAQVILGLLIK